MRSRRQNILERLEATQGDVHAQAAVMADFLLSAFPENQRDVLRDSLDAAGVLHWFDSGLLQHVLDISTEDARSRFETLKTLNFVESYGRSRSGLYNVHEATRLGWRKLLAKEASVRFRRLSFRAAACFADDRSPAGRVEWSYHLLCGDPDAGATALEALSREWGDSARPEDRYALATALEELGAAGLIAGRARAWTLLFIAWTRRSRGDTARLTDAAAEALKLATETGDAMAEADAQCLLGDVLQAQGQLAAAKDAYGQSLAICRRVAEQDPSNAGWQRGLALAWLRLARLDVAAGRHGTALALYENSFRIQTALGDRTERNAQWAQDNEVVQSELAWCRSQVSGPE